MAARSSSVAFLRMDAARRRAGSGHRLPCGRAWRRSCRVFPGCPGFPRAAPCIRSGGEVFDAADDVREERVMDGGHDDDDTVALLPAQAAGQRIGAVAGLADRTLDPLTVAARTVSGTPGFARQWLPNLRNAGDVTDRGRLARLVRVRRVIFCLSRSGAIVADARCTRNGKGRLTAVSVALQAPSGLPDAQRGDAPACTADRCAVDTMVQSTLGLPSDSLREPTMIQPFKLAP